MSRAIKNSRHITPPLFSGAVNERERGRKKIAFFGHFGSGNFGNESTLQAMLYHTRGFMPDVEVTCITTGPEATAATYHIEAIPPAERLFKSWKPRNPLLKWVRKVCIGMLGEPYWWVKAIITLSSMGMLIIPGTGLLTDAYGLLGFGPYSLFRWSLSAKLCRCKLLFVSVGAGPIYGVMSRCLIKAALALADFRSYRDHSSIQYLKGIGFRPADDPIYPDLVFSLPEPLIEHQNNNSKARSLVGLGLMCHAGKYGVPRPSHAMYLAYLENLVSFVEWTLAQDYDLRFLIGDVADIRATQEFKGLLKKRLSAHDERRILDEPASSVEHLISQIAVTEIVVATRFHNLVLALLNNKPVIAISFHHKCASLMSAMGLSEYCLDINHLKAKELIEKLGNLEKNADKLKPLIREKMERYRKALDEQYKFIFRNM